MNVGDEHMTLPPTSSHSTKPQLSAAAANNDSQKSLFLELQHLKEERLQLLARIKVLEELNHDFTSRHGDMQAVDSAFDEETSALSDLPDRILELSEDVRQIKQKINAMEENRLKSRGKRMMYRIEKLEELLKDYGGSQTFKRLQIDLGLSPSQFTRIVSCLDKRIFKVERCPGAQRGEKMLILK
jgi:chromosome segregation ATPase